MTSTIGRRRRPRALVTGKTVPVDLATVRELQNARERLAAAKLDLRRVTARLELALGDAEFGAVADLPVVMRDQAKTGGHYIGVHYRDDLRIIASMRLDDARPQLGSVP